MTFYRIKIIHEAVTKSFIVRSHRDIDELTEMAQRYGYTVKSWSIEHGLTANDVFNELVMAELGC